MEPAGCWVGPEVVFFWYFYTTTAPHLYYKYEVVHTIHSLLNTSVKVSDGAHHYLSRKTSLKLLCYVMLVRLG